MTEYILWFEQLGMHDVSRVGGKNASLGEMISNLSGAGIQVPGGFATTAEAYREFLLVGDIGAVIKEILADLNIDDVNALTAAGAKIRATIMNTPLHPPLQQAVTTAYSQLLEASGSELAVAVRSSATAEDLPDASFAGQQETFLNVRGLNDVLRAIHEVFASLFNDRAIAYREHQGFDHNEVALSAGIQRMVRSDIGASGVMFSIDTESGFTDAVFITSAWGLGECVVQGSVNPDEFYVYKPALAAGKPAILRHNLGTKAIKMIYSEDPSKKVETIDVSDADRQHFSISDQEVTELARMAVTIERHYGRPMDIEWGKDGQTGELMILQARPETVKSRDDKNLLERYVLNEKGDILCEGRSIGQRIGAGTVRVVLGLKQLDRVQAGDVLVTDITDPDWEPVMKRASAIVTNRGGRTCHAAIIARELGVPAVVGCGDATSALTDGDAVTVSCAEGDTGFIYAGKLDFAVNRISLDTMPKLPFKIMMNVGNPERAFDFQSLPNHGVGLARLEFIINNTIGIHPKALLNLDRQEAQLQATIRQRMAGYDDPVEFFVQKLQEGIATLGAAFAPSSVIVRMSDFKSNEYANMIGGRGFEPHEENPMIGFRGASRYIDPSFRDCFELECRAMRYVRDEMGITNIWLMIPFVRTLDEARQVIDILARNGLERGKNGLKVIMMCEIPSNALLADEFLEYFDGFSIGSNDLTQLTLGLDRDSGLIAQLFDERNPAVKKLLHMAIASCLKAGKYIG
ncbi:MAG TPA: phosphoenolpyruvate synthase, partial [Gammaproteobacteria bacterium]|nr:phosphoenolpyruvate synthase [Gammaproteobacteria bacterium]